MQKHLTPFREVTPLPPTMADVLKIANQSGQSIEEVQRTVAAAMTVPMFENNYYTVQKRFCDTVIGPMHHLSIRRNDRKPVHDWNDLQWIKNQLVGPEFEAVELYPAESRLMDDANQYHLWVFMQEGKLFPFGVAKRAT